MIYVQNGENDTLKIYQPSNISGVPSDVKFRIGTPNYQMDNVGGESVATVDTVSIATSIISKAGDLSLNFATNPNFTTHAKYHIKTVSGLECTFEPLNSGSITRISQALPFAIESGSLVSGIEISVPISAAQSDESGLGLLNISAIISGKKQYWQQEFKIVDVLPRLTLNWNSLIEMLPECDRMRPRSNFEPSKILDAAWRMTLKPDLQNLGIKIQYIKDWEALEHVHALAVCNNLTNSTDSNNTDRIRQTWIRYNSALKKIIERPEFWYSQPLSMSKKDDNDFDNSTIRLTR
jgi:hypothetical protein